MRGTPALLPSFSTSLDLKLREALAQVEALSTRPPSGPLVAELRQQLRIANERCRSSEASWRGEVVSLHRRYQDIIEAMSSQQQEQGGEYTFRAKPVAPPGQGRVEVSQVELVTE